MYNEPEDLLLNESFLAWYYKVPGAEPQKWEQWMKGHPERTRLIQQAISILDATRLLEEKLPVQQIANAENRLLGLISAAPAASFVPLKGSGERGPGESQASRTIIFGRRRWMVAAAICVLLSAGLLVTAIRSSKGTVIRTGFGQIAQRQLPDGSDVMLDANSHIRYRDDWSEGKDREVWLNGEAFFHVRPTPQHSRFVVHLQHVDVIVTGTKFNVVNRHGTESVFLEEGSVLLRRSDGQQLRLTPGEFAGGQRQQWEKKTVRGDSLMAWKEQRLVFDGTPLRELVTIVNDHYDVHLQLADSSIGNQTISAILPNNNLDVLLEALEATAEFDISRDGDRITIGRRSGSR